MALEQSNKPTLIIGIDEAGKGPVLGSMFIAGVAVTSDYLFASHIRDSKLLSYSQILKIYNLNQSLSNLVLQITPYEIDNKNINLILLQSSCKIINHFLKLYETTHHLLVYIDCPWVSELKFHNELLILLNRIDLKDHIFIKHKGDLLFPCVSLASIFAKHNREKHVAELKVILKQDFGSGYPSDVKTKSYVRRNPQCVYRRFKWRLT